MHLSQILRTDEAGGLPALFKGRRVHYCYNTRVAIRRACDLLGLAPGDEVLAPAYNCGSELDPFLHAGMAVSLYPVGAQGVVDAAGIAPLISSRTRAVYLTHYFGFLQPDAAAIRALCDAHGLFLIEDCALSLLSGRHPVEGHVGEIALFCFYKFFPSLAGGAMVINSDRVPSPRFDRSLPVRMMAKPRIKAGLDMVLGAERRRALLRGQKHEDLPAEGERPDMPASYYFDPRLEDARLDPLAARQIRSFDVSGAIARRRANYALYLALLPGDLPLFPDLPDWTCPLSMPVRVRARNALTSALMAQGIAATPWWAGYHRGLDFPDQGEACHLKDHVLSLPCHQYLGEAEIRHIAASLMALRPQGARDLPGKRE